MDFDLPEDIVYRLLGVSVSFDYFDQTLWVNPYTKVTLSNSTYMDLRSDSHFKIGFNLFNLFPNFSFDIFSINSRARELGMKLNGLIDDGEISVETSFNYIAIKVCVYKSSFRYANFKGSIKITIYLPPSNNNIKDNYEYNRHVTDEEFEARQNWKKACAGGMLAIGGFLLFKLIKGGIGFVVSGPVGAAVGFAC